MELKIKTHNFVSIPRTNSGSSSLRTKVFQNPRMTFFPDDEEVAGARPSYGATGEQTDGEQIITLNFRTGPLDLDQ